MNKVILGCLAMVALSGCQTIPHTVQGDVTPMTLTQARNTDASPTVRWGGIVAKVENKDKQSIIEVVAKPLEGNARPQDVDGSSGRFFAILPEFIDPMVYEKGREITVIGQLSDMIEGKIGEMNYLFPVVRVTGHHLWRKRPLLREVHYYPTSFWPHFPHRYYYHSHWHHYPKGGKKSTPNRGKESGNKPPIEKRK